MGALDTEVYNVSKPQVPSSNTAQTTQQESEGHDVKILNAANERGTHERGDEKNEISQAIFNK